MSLPVSFLVTDAALKIGDPRFVRVTLGDWLGFYNQSTRELCQKADVMQYISTFNLGTQALYPYPDEMKTMTGLEASETPSNESTYRQVTEIFRDEFRAMTSGSYPTGTIPDHYFADKAGFYLVGRPLATIAAGGRITYFGLPDRITDVTTANFQLPEYVQDYVIRRMVVYGKYARHRIVEADAELKLWYADLEGLQDDIDDRSKDRVSSLRPRLNRYQGHN